MISVAKQRDRPEHVHFAFWCHGHDVPAVSAVIHGVFEGVEVVLFKEW